MSDIKCPFCNKPLHCGATLKSDEYLVELYQCANPECESTEFLVGCKEFWDILGQHRRTRKALELAITGLKNCKTREHIGAVCRIPEYVDKVLEQITAERKDVK